MSSRFNFHRDLMFLLVRAPADWKPTEIYDVPPAGKLLSKMPVASFDEAHEDLIRSNSVAMRLGQREWALIQWARSEA